MRNKAPKVITVTTSTALSQCSTNKTRLPHSILIHVSTTGKKIKTKIQIQIKERQNLSVELKGPQRRIGLSTKHRMWKILQLQKDINVKLKKSLTFEYNSISFHQFLLSSFEKKK